MPPGIKLIVLNHHIQFPAGLILETQRSHKVNCFFCVKFDTHYAVLDHNFPIKGAIYVVGLERSATFAIRLSVSRMQPNLAPNDKLALTSYQLNHN